MANKGKITQVAAALVVCLFVTNVNAQNFKTSGSVAASEEDIKSLKEFAVKLQDCTPYSMNYKHPLVATFTAEKKIIGLGTDGKCKISETMPSQPGASMSMECNIPSDVMLKYAAAFKAMADKAEQTKSWDMDSGSEFSKISSDVMRSSCVPVLNGKAMR
jgi:hypothetical protein